MRIIGFLISLTTTICLIFIFNNTWNIRGNAIPALGKFLSPQHGCWQNAEPTDYNFTANLKFPELKGKVEIFFDERLIPHVFAEQENDAYFVQGYLHAKFRLWQMDLQTRAAAGRLSEVMGPDLLVRDREFRRLGIVFAAENSLKAIEEDPVIKLECDAYTSGVNAYIDGLNEKSFPLEYKLIGYKPERWSNLKSAIFMKLMSYDLAGYENDFEMTNAKNYFSSSDFAKLFPEMQDSLDAIIPKGTPITKQKVFPITPSNANSIYFNQSKSSHINGQKPDKANGSNNWVIGGKKTKSGSPILCNDPHLSLGLPSVWYEMQISAPNLNIYGVSFPGAPGIMIGFNDSCAFGFTNGERDVRDYYEIKFKGASRSSYLFNGKWEPTSWRVDTLQVAGKANFIDSVAYVKLGEVICPVMYDKNFGSPSKLNQNSYAVRWKGHDSSNELKAFNMLNHSNNYDDYLRAIVNLHTPGQNCAFACKNGDIAIRTQGDYPAKWKGQGDFIMPGFDNTYLWQGMIPQDEVPFQYNPARGFASSANQKSVDDSNYPYYLGRDYPIYRGKIINRNLSSMNMISAEDMMAMQTDNYNLFAEMARPLLINNLKEEDFSSNESRYLRILKDWNLKNDIGSEGATVFDVYWDNFFNTVFNDEFANAPDIIQYPSKSTLLEALLKDKNYSFLDNISTPQTETLADNLRIAYKKSVIYLQDWDSNRRLQWEKYKGTRISHLTGLKAFGRSNLMIGGGGNCINATTKNHGPGWRMIVSLTQKTEAYGVYAGGQSGNPGSKFFDNFIDSWAKGKYYPLWVMSKADKNDKRIAWKMSLSN